MASNYFIDQEFEKEVGSDDEIPKAEHGKLLNAVHLMDSNQRIKPPTRTEPSLNVSEFDLAPVEGGRVHLKDLAKSLENKGKPFDAKVAEKILKLTKQSKTLEKPLEKPEAEKIKRVVGYKNLKQHVGRWDAIIHTNRAARTITFPMNIEPLSVRRNTSDLAAQWRSQAQTPLEKGLQALQEKCETYQKDLKKEEKFRLTLAELREKRQEIAKLRARLSYEAAKAKRQKKIKSKGYHRLLRKEKMQQQLKEFEKLQKTDPEAALKRLEELDRIRAEERMTLRHKSTGHWARSRLIRAKYDTQTQRELAEQLAVSRELTKKMKATNSDDENDANENDADDVQSQPKVFVPGDEDNPWITVKPASEVEEFYSGYRKFWEKKEKEKSDKESKEEQEPAMRKENGIEHNDINEEENILEADEMSNDVELIIKTTHLKNSEEQKSCTEINNKNIQYRKNEQSSVNFEDVLQKNTDEEKCYMERSDNEQNNNSKEINLSVDASEIMFDNSDKIENEYVKAVSKARRKLKRKKEFKNASEVEVRSTCKSWIVTTISAQETEQKPCETTAANKRLESFISSVLPVVDQKTTKGKRKRIRKTQLDKMFEEAEENISAKIQDKISNLKTHLNSTNTLDSKLKKSKNNFLENDLGESLALKNAKELRPNEDVELLDGSENTSHEHTDLAELAKQATGIEVCIRNSNASSGVDGNVPGNEPTDHDHSKPPQTNINPDNFIVAKPKVLLTSAPDLMTAGEEALDELMEDQQMIMTEAFADDNVVDDFRKEKDEEIQKSQPGDIDLSLPGWGEWGGDGIKPKKKRRLIIKAPSALPRRDACNEKVIIREEKGAIRSKQVNELPQPFHSVEDFEASIRAPIGSTWIPQTAHRKLIEPTVITKLGHVIKPMDEEFLVKKKILLEFAD